MSIEFEFVAADAELLSDGFAGIDLFDSLLFAGCGEKEFDAAVAADKLPEFRLLVVLAEMLDVMKGETRLVEFRGDASCGWPEKSNVDEYDVVVGVVC